MPPKKRPVREAPEIVLEFQSDSEEEEDVQPVRSTRRTRSSVATPKEPQPTPKKVAFVEEVQEQHIPILEEDPLDRSNEIPDDDEDLLNIEIPPKPQDFDDDPKNFRLMIQRIEVENFKSYRGKHSIGPFHKNLTMIFGPNGSGKSNVIDALLFVFGFRSSKIRSKKLCSLIHSAAALGGQRCKFAKVEIIFQMIRDKGKEHYEIKRGSEVGIGRTVFLDNSSKYTINERIVTFKEVEVYLKRSGIDLIHNRFLILQGEVEAIAMMKPKATNPGEEGMLEYIEDMVGSNRFVPFIRKLEHRVSQLEVLSSQQSLRVRDSEREKKEMEPDVRHAQQFINAQNEAATLKSKLIQIDRYRLTNDKLQLESEIKDKEAELKELEEKKRSFISEINDIEELENKNSNDQEKVHDEIESSMQQIRDAEAAEARRKMTLKKCNNELVRLHKEIDSERKQKAEIESIPEKARRRIEMLDDESKELLEQEDHDRKMASTNLIKFEKKAKEEETRKEQLEEEYSRRNAIANEARTKVTVGEAELQDLKNLAERDKRKLEELRNSQSEAEQKYDADKKAYTRVKKELPAQEKSLEEVKNKLPQIKEEENELRLKVARLRDKYEEETSGYQTLLKGSRVHNSLLNAKASGVLPGLLGRLGDLGAIDEIYDAAISTTCPQLDWYVVETSEDGQQAIDYLIESFLPRCSFMCIDQLIKNHAGMNKNPNSFPAPRLFDLLRITDPNIRKIFYQCLGDMLVVPTLLDAQKIDRDFQGKYRIVTYEGNTIERTGAVSGGGRPITGRIGRDIRAPPSEAMQEEFRRTRAEYDQANMEHQNVYAEMLQIEQKTAELTKKVQGMTEEKRRLELSIPEQSDLIDSLKRAIKEQEKEVSKVKILPKDMDKKEAALEKLRKERNDAEASAKSSQVKVNKCAEKINLMFNELVQKHKDRAETAKERYNKCQQEMAKEQASITNSAHNFVSVQKNIDNLDTLIMKKRIECDALATAEADGKEVFNLHDLVRNRRKKLSLLRDAAADLRKKRNNLDQDEREHSKKVVDMRDLVTTLNQTLDDIELNLENIYRQMGLLRIRIVPSFKKYQNIQGKQPLTWGIDDEEDEDGGEKDNEEEDEFIGSDTEFEEIPVLTEDEVGAISKADKDRMREKLRDLECYMERNRANTDETIFQLYTHKAEMYIKAIGKLDLISDKLTTHRKKMGELKAKRLSEFSEALLFLGATTQALYQMITNGGNASLQFVEEGRSSDPFEAGVKFSVRPARKSWKLIENLSGGEKTLASLCFVFAMHHYRSTPLYVMDEIDAALDSQNVGLIASYIKSSERTRNAQFIIISLRNQMFQVGNRFLGIYKVIDCTHNIMFQSEDLKALLKKTTQVLNEKVREGIVEEEEDDNIDEEALNEEMEQIAISRKNRKKEKKPVKLKIADPDLDLDDGIASLTAPSRNDIEGPSMPAKALESANPFDFEDDDVPAPKRRRRTVREEDEEEDEDVVEENHPNHQNNQDSDEDSDDGRPSTSAAYYQRRTRNERRRAYH